MRDLENLDTVMEEGSVLFCVVVSFRFGSQSYRVVGQILQDQDGFRRVIFLMFVFYFLYVVVLKGGEIMVEEVQMYV